MPAKILTPRQSLNKAYLKEKILRSEIDLFKNNLSKLFETIDHEEREENVKTILRDFLNNTYYQDKHFINTLRDIDLVIYLENNQNKAAVLAEVKRPKNKLEMITRDNLNAKAMHELILYYLEERIDYKNNDIKFLIATNIYEWFIFDATVFEHLFFKNKSLVKNYERWRDKQKTSGNTDLFYNEIAKPFLDELKSEIMYTYFDFGEYIKSIVKNESEVEKKLIALYKILSPVHLLKQPFSNDSNSLDRNFYNELLHIIGLVETKEKNKKLINRKPEKERDFGSIIENTILILKTENTLAKTNNPEKYGGTNDEQIYNLALELSITWVNRILFLKLLEAQLYKYHNDDKYKFLNRTIVNDFDELYKLFHQVLAIPNSERTGFVIKKFGLVPYLNSSLFEISDLESETIKINSLDDNTPIELYKNTVLKDKSGKKRIEKLPVLHYLFEFLDAYDFTSEGKEEIQEDKKTLINASVLGLIFEKINGYKDGSFFTPGFITMYMCRETLRRAVVQKFNDKYNWKCETLNDVKNHLAPKRNTGDILEFNSVINSIKICDPAVGSGHFLVSALNELIAIKSELGLLADLTGTVLSGYEAKVENDELIITYNNSEDIFEYHPPKTPLSFSRREDGGEVQRVQETLFNEKQTIIENCLFGVDINPNSVKIARLRLWIELLKNAFYTKESSYSELETLPNIDINIKEGNSLISRFDLHDKEAKILDSTRQKIRLATVKYKEQVFIYKSTNDKATKDAARKNIKQIKDSFALMANPIDKEYKRLRELENSIMQEVLSFDRESVEQWNKKRKKDQGEYDRLKIEYDNKLKTLYHNAFEWRFEFPEVLDEDGKFVGFDVVIGNPPYVYNRNLTNHLRTYYQSKYNTADDLYVYFFFLSNSLLKINAFVCLITPNTYLTLSTREYFRNLLLQNKIITLIDSGYAFIDAYVETIITLFSNSLPYKNKVEFNTGLHEGIFHSHHLIEQDIYKTNFLKRIFLPTPLNYSLFNKYRKKFDSLYQRFPRTLSGKFDNKEIDDLREYQANLASGEITLLGLIADGEQGLVTGNNSKYLAQIVNSVEDENKLLLQLYQEVIKHKKVDINEEYLHRNKGELYSIVEQIKKLKKNPSFFGRFYNYKTALKKDCTSYKDLSNREKSNGIKQTKKRWIFYNRGNPEGYKWIVPYAECIDWSENSVKELKEGKFTNSRWQGEKYFNTTGFAWVDYFTDELKAFFVDKGVYSKNIVKLHSSITLSDLFIVCTLNSKFTSYFVKNFITQTHTLQINDGRLIPIIIPTKAQEENICKIANKILQVKHENPASDTSLLESEIDKLVYQLYGLTEEEIKIVDGK